MQRTTPSTERSFAPTHESAPRRTWACLPHPPPLRRPWRQNLTHLVLSYSPQAWQCWLWERRSSGAGARGSAVLVLLRVPWRVASISRRGCSWRRCGGASVCALVRRVLFAARVRVSVKSRVCGGARGAEAVVLLSFPWRVASFWRRGGARRRCGGAPVDVVALGVVLAAGVLVHFTFVK